MGSGVRARVGWVEATPVVGDGDADVAFTRLDLHPQRAPEIADQTAQLEPERASGPFGLGGVAIVPVDVAATVAADTGRAGVAGRTGAMI